MDFRKNKNEEVVKKLSRTANKIRKNRKNSKKLIREKEEFEEIKELLNNSDSESSSEGIVERESLDLSPSSVIPIRGPGIEILEEDKIFSLFDEDTLSLKDFIKGNEWSCLFGEDDKVPNEDLFRTLIAHHLTETFLPDEERCPSISLYVLYLLSVHPDYSFASACRDFLNYRRFKIGAFDILPIYVNFGFVLEKCLGSRIALELPMKIERRWKKARKIYTFPYRNAEMVAEVILDYAKLGLIKRDEELKLLLKAFTRLTLDPKIRSSRLLHVYSFIVSVFSSQLAQVYEIDEVASCLQLNGEHILNQLEVLRVIHWPISSKLHDSLIIKTINNILDSDVLISDKFEIKEILSVLKELKEKELTPLEVYCILQLINGSLPRVTATAIEAGDINNVLANLETDFIKIQDQVDLIRLKLEIAKLRNSIMNNVDKVFPGTKKKMVDFLKDLGFLILPLGMGSKRLKFFEEQIKKHSGKLSDKSKATHVIIDESVGGNKGKCLMALKNHGIVVGSGCVKIVGTKWLSKCFAVKNLIDTESYEFDWVKEEKEEEEEEMELSKEGGRVNGIGSGDGAAERAAASVDASPEKRAKIESEKYVCSQASALSGDMSDKKKLIVNELCKLADAFAARHDTWRSYSYRKAVGAVTRYDGEITTYQEACKIPGIGERMALKIMEIIESGKCAKAEEILDGETKILESFCNIWGVGPSTAESWYRLGYRSLDDVREKAKLSKQQEIGVKFYKDFTVRMRREEAERIADVVAQELKMVSGRSWIELVGSYRRGKETCGDVDVMIVNPGPKCPGDILTELTDRLGEKGYLTDHLVSPEESGSEDGRNHRRYMGVFKFLEDGEIHRRIDIFVVPEEEYAAGLMHYTGSAIFNRSIRLLASRKGFTLSEHGLYTGIIRKGSDKMNRGQLVPTPTEKDIFNYLGLEYKSPEERDH